MIEIWKNLDIDDLENELWKDILGNILTTLAMYSTQLIRLIVIVLAMFLPSFPNGLVR
jgi:hypothetical protein